MLSWTETKGQGMRGSDAILDFLFSLTMSALQLLKGGDATLCHRLYELVSRSSVQNKLRHAKNEGSDANFKGSFITAFSQC